MKLTPFKLVTVIADQRLKQKLIEFFQDAGITGYTYGPVYGRGRSLLDDTPGEEAENIQFEILVSPFVSRSLMKVIHKNEFSNGGVIVFEQDASVVRPEKFGGERPA